MSLFCIDFFVIISYLFTEVHEDLTINYGVFGQQFHFEKHDSNNNIARYGCYGEPNRDPTYYIANSNGYQTLTKNQFDQVSHIFPTKCNGDLKANKQFEQRTARLLGTIHKLRWQYFEDFLPPPPSLTSLLHKLR